MEASASVLSQRCGSPLRRARRPAPSGGFRARAGGGGRIVDVSPNLLADRRINTTETNTTGGGAPQTQNQPAGELSLGAEGRYRAALLPGNYRR
jgi:hypothetical protein